MRNARIHPRTLGYLGRALSLELSAVQQYMTQASLAEAWELPDAARRFREETVEEMQHAQRIIQRMLVDGVAPNASQLRPAGVARSLPELLRQDMDLELEIVGLYADAVQFSRRIGDGDHGDFFAALLEEERHHAREMEAWLVSLGVPSKPTGAERAYF